MTKEHAQKQQNKTVRIAWIVFIAILAATLIAELFIKRNAVFALEGKMFFHAWFGFIACVVIILFSKILGFFIKRQEGYYKEKR